MRNCKYHIDPKAIQPPNSLLPYYCGAGDEFLVSHVAALLLGRERIRLEQARKGQMHTLSVGSGRPIPVEKRPKVIVTSFW